LLSKEGFSGTNNEVKATHDLLICITGISGNETLAKLYSSSRLAVQGMDISTKHSLVEIRQNEHQSNSMIVHGTALRQQQ